MSVSLSDSLPTPMGLDQVCQDKVKGFANMKLLSQCASVVTLTDDGSDVKWTLVLQK